MKLHLMLPGPYSQIVTDAQVVLAAIGEFEIATQVNAGTAGLLSREAVPSEINRKEHLDRVWRHGPWGKSGIIVYDAEPGTVLRDAPREGEWADDYLSLVSASVRTLGVMNPGAKIGVYGMPMDARPGTDWCAYLAAYSEAWQVLRYCDVVTPVLYDRSNTYSTKIDAGVAEETVVAASVVGKGMPVVPYVSPFYGGDGDTVPIKNWVARLEAAKASGTDGAIIWANCESEWAAKRAATALSGEHGKVIREIIA